MQVERRALILAAFAAAAPRVWGNEAAAAAALQRGGVVAVFRHALAPGTYDPPGMRLEDCASQRNLNDEGRAQARRIGAWFRAHGLHPAAVRSSPWCRCLDTARGAFGTAQTWDELGSSQPRGEAERAAQLQALRAAVAQVGADPRPGRFEVWVTHQFVITGLATVATASAEGLVLRAAAGGAVQVVAPLVIA